MKTAAKLKLDIQLADEAKSIVALAFRNGPIEDIHAGRECPTCARKAEYSHITQDGMKRIMKRAVDKCMRSCGFGLTIQKCSGTSFRLGTAIRLGGTCQKIAAKKLSL